MRSDGVNADPIRGSPAPTRSTVTPSGTSTSTTILAPASGTVEQPAQPLQRGEPPLLLAAVRASEIVRVTAVSAGEVLAAELSPAD